MIKWKGYLKNTHNNNIKNDLFWNKIRRQKTTKSNVMIMKKKIISDNKNSNQKKKKDIRII